MAVQAPAEVAPGKSAVELEPTAARPNGPGMRLGSQAVATKAFEHAWREEVEAQQRFARERRAAAEKSVAARRLAAQMQSAVPEVPEVGQETAP